VILHKKFFYKKTRLKVSELYNNKDLRIRA